MDLSTRPAAGRMAAAWCRPIHAGLAWRKRLFSRFDKLLGWLTVAALVSGAQAAAQDRPPGFSLDELTEKARTLSGTPYVAPVSNLPEAFKRLQFADYQKIQPRRDRFAWTETGSQFKMAFYHQGMQFNTPVKINEIADGGVREIPYDPGSFDFGDMHFDRDVTSKLGWAGFRLLFPINQPGKNDEVMSVLGASYFRVIGKEQVYGLSGRGLAIDTGLPIAEEFPAFREFWIRRPGVQDRDVTFYALLDSPRATGAYEFTLVLGDETRLDVKARVFMRAGQQPAALGVAPLTSMFLFGPNQPPSTPTFRSAIHDSNGLAIHTGSDEWIWRPLNNPSMVAISSFAVDNPKGFGLLQRGREFSRYEDLKDRYDLRPSAWIEPINNWGKGHVRLIEIPTADETNDNIVALWAPDAMPAAGQPLHFDYRIHWTTNEPAILKGGLSYAWQTLRTMGEFYQSNLIRANDGTLAFLVDFRGPSLRDLPHETPLAAAISANDNVEIVGTELRPNPVIKGWRLAYRVKIKDATKVSELRAALTLEGRALTETWSYQLPPMPPKATGNDNPAPVDNMKADGSSGQGIVSSR